ncbi:hypothetical protein AMECASPLE_023473 [Ameca splendens]|uniref:Uncharacterized protein n=1 Tax=Ameca splendens TaxID=208324 RepID=A0ABV0ZDE5_9TELE
MMVPVRLYEVGMLDSLEICKLPTKFSLTAHRAPPVGPTGYFTQMDNRFLKFNWYQTEFYPLIGFHIFRSPRSKLTLPRCSTCFTFNKDTINQNTGSGCSLEFCLPEHLLPCVSWMVVLVYGELVQA